MEAAHVVHIMNSRERVKAAIEHRPHDRVPVDIGANYATGLTIGAYHALRAHLGMAGPPIRVVDTMQMLAEVERPVMDALGTDVIGIHVGGGAVHGWQAWRMPDGVAVQMPADLDLRRRPDGGWDQWRAGAPHATMPPGGHYFDPLDYPQWPVAGPGGMSDELLRDLERRARLLHENTDRAIILNGPWAISNSTSADFMCALLMEKDEAHDRLDRWAEAIVRDLAGVVDAVDGHVQAVCFSGDAGSQRGPLFGPDLYREMIVPHMRKVTDYVHRHSGMKCFLHSCGSVFRLIECFIEMGMDILNPIQLSAAEMDPGELVRAFGGRIVFWGGGCDTQAVLPRGTAAEVAEEVRRRMAVFATVPGYVFSQVHNIQPDVPVRNMIALIEAAAGRALAGPGRDP